MSSSYLNASPMSLVERKKLQWAREREEMQRLAGTWKSQDSTYDDPYDRTKQPPPTDRRSSLPPLEKTQYPSNPYDRGGETSGYGSDNQHSPDRRYHAPPPISDEYQRYEHAPSRGHANQERDHAHSSGGYANQGRDHAHSSGGYANQERRPSQNCGYESSSSYRDDRPKWGDKGVGVAKFWQPKEEEETVRHEPPNWVKRGLQDGEIVVASTSPTESPPLEEDRPYTGSSYSQKRCFIRGQNIPIDSSELAERERRRQMAIAHQQAIKQQLEERERKRREERERILREEREEELRIQRDKEIERKRKEEEERIFREKQERERRRKEAIQEAMEIAEREAKLQKIKNRMSKLNTIDNNNISENVQEKEKIVEPPIKLLETKKEEKLNNTKAISPRPAEPINKEINNNLEQSKNTQVQKQTETTVENIQNSTSTVPLQTPRADNVALILQTPEGFQNFQYAVLVPAAIPVNIPQTDRSYVASTSRTENRILTPTQYRNNKRMCDSSTQTDFYDSSSTNSRDSMERAKEKLTNLELGYESSRKYRGARRESVEERPKWGANRPPTRYLKQSEKDLLYQRKKNRQKQRDANNSSDDSQCPSPRSYRKKGYVSKRATWRKNDEIYTRNIKMYQSELIPLESNKNEIYYKCCCTCRCKKHKCGENLKVDILKIEHNSPRENIEYKEERMERNMLPDFENNADNKVDILDKLTSLHNGLLLEQEKWENSPRTPSLSNH